MLKREYLASFVVMLAVWGIAAAAVGNDILIPYPHAVFIRMASLLMNAGTWKTIGMTAARVLKGTTVSFLAALAAAVVSDVSGRADRLLAPFAVLANTIPNISYMIIALIWLGSEGAVSLVTFMILFPLFFNSFRNRLRSVPGELADVRSLYPESLLMRTVKVTLPRLVQEMILSARTGFSMGLKVGVMAETLGAVRIGIGRQMNYAKVNLDTTGLIAWTMIIILLSVMVDLGFDGLLKTLKEEREWKG